MLIPKGRYSIKVVNAEIKVNKAHKKYIALTVEITDGPYKGQHVFSNMVPWYLFSWMSHLNAFFSIEEIKTYMLEYTDEDTIWVVCQLILGESAIGRVFIVEHRGRKYNQIMPCREGI